MMNCGVTFFLDSTLLYFPNFLNEFELSEKQKQKNNAKYIKKHYFDERAEHRQILIIV